jgi:hypothetical protein
MEPPSSLVLVSMASKIGRLKKGRSIKGRLKKGRPKN